MGEKKTNPNLNDAMCIYNKAYFETDHTEEQPLVILWYKTLQKNVQCMCVDTFAFMQLYHTTRGALDSVENTRFTAFYQMCI